MANEFRHVPVGVQLTQTEYESLTGHELVDGVDGDIIIRSGGELIRLAKGSDGEFLKLAAGLPGWSAESTYTDAEAVAAVEGEATLDLAGDVTIDGAKSLSVDVINEKDSAAGVTIDSVLLKDGLVDGIDVAARDHDKYTDAEAVSAVSLPQFVPGSPRAGNYILFVTVFKDANGAPDRCVVVAILSTNTISFIEYKRLDNAWVFDSADCGLDVEVTLNFTADNITRMTAFAIDSPVASGDRILFISGNNNDTTDTFEMDSIIMNGVAANAHSAVAVVIAGANQPVDTNTIATMSIALSTTRAMTFFNDDAHFADITEAAGTYTFTYTDSIVTAVDTSIEVESVNARAYSGIIIGSQVVLFQSHGLPTSSAMWEMNAAATLTEEFNPFSTGVASSDNDDELRTSSAITAIEGSFALAAPVGGTGTTGQKPSFILSEFPLDSI